jgi:hypothetical protein
MAHGRTGPDIVMTTRYAHDREVIAVSNHEQNRTPDGSSAIDPERSHLNEVLVGPATQSEALELLYKSGVRNPAKQAEAPYVQTVISASPEYFEDGNRGWDAEKLKAWRDETLKWLKKEYGSDLVHVSLHLDETTPHMHILVVPTYTKKARKPSQRLKAKVPETDDEFATRLQAWEDDVSGIRTAGRSTNSYWSRNYARKYARESYHEAVQHLGLGYGKDFVGDNEPSPEHVKTGTWVREQASFLKEKENDLVARETRIEERESSLSESEEQARKMRNTADKEWALAAKARMKAESVFEDVTSLHDKIMKIHERVLRAVRDVAKKLGVSFSLSAIEDAARELRKDEISAQKQHLLEAIRKPEKLPEDPGNDLGSFPEEPPEEARDDSPGF